MIQVKGSMLEKKEEKRRKKRSKGVVEKEYKFAGYLLIPLVLIVFFAFYKTYFVDPPGFKESVHLLVHAHTLILSLWVLMLIAQPLLVLYKKNKIHRLLGKVSYVLVPLVIVTSIGMMFDVFYRAQLDNIPLIDNYRNLLFPFASNTMMILFFILAIINAKRKNIPNHTRYMIGMAIIILDPTISRIAIFWYDIPYPEVMSVTYFFIDTLLLCLIAYDVWNKLDYKPYLVVTSCFLFFQMLFYGSFYL